MSGAARRIELERTREEGEPDEERRAIQDEAAGILTYQPRRRAAHIHPLAAMSGADLSRPLPPVPWLCRELQFATGRPLLFTAAAGTGKTWVLSSFLISVAAGHSSWLGRYQLQASGPVLHLNADMAKRPLIRRYQRMAKGMGLRLDDLPLHVVNSEAFPDGFSLLHPDAEETLTATVETYRAVVVLIDALNPMLGGADENKAECAHALRALTRVSDRTGVTFFVIHHHGKPKDGEGGGRRGTQHKARGSSAIVDACDATFSIERAEFDGGMRIEQGKASMGSHIEPFYVRLEDIGPANDDGCSDGIRVVHVDPEEARQRIGETPTDTDALADSIVRALEERGPLSRQDIANPGMVTGNRSMKGKAMDQLIEAGRVVSEKDGRTTMLRLP